MFQGQQKFPGIPFPQIPQIHERLCESGRFSVLVGLFHLQGEEAAAVETKGINLELIPLETLTTLTGLSVPYQPAGETVGQENVRIFFRPPSSPDKKPPKTL